jgi:hypothetical protein
VFPEVFPDVFDVREERLERAGDERERRLRRRRRPP